MAAKIEYVVADGCIQDGTNVVQKGEVFMSSNKEVLELLIEEGKITPRGKLPSKDEQDGGD
ncbi:hypothetical protein [Pseudomonas inefficax]|uniref:Uncharacterized protein n=1 Tax=Pseudomonas inefficax TaxID=2078786 RepID=A0AAQ1SSJ7_9PSED|nr:hypothetical protein [Pseudomonas inefficax]SPO59711.1 conserved protein of unknown function [Pseudomonas inefficax]